MANFGRVMAGDEKEEKEEEDEGERDITCHLHGCANIYVRGQ